MDLHRLKAAKRRLDVAHSALMLGVNGHHALQDAVAAYVRAVHEATTAPTPLTPREREVLKLIALGKSSREIAAQLGISFKTVVAHGYHLHQKLKVHKNVELTRVALRMGLIKA